MLGTLAIFFHLIALVWATAIGHTTYGTHFVAAIPPVGNRSSQEIGKIYFTTEEQPVKVDISIPYTISDCTAVHFVESISIRRFENVPYEFDKKYVMRETGMFNAISINTSSPIRAYLDLGEYDLQRSDFVTLIPLESCMASYSVVTLIGHPYVSVISFDKDTNLRVEFPHFARNFSLVCKGADKPCESNTTVNVRLKRYNVWFLHLNDSGYDLHSTLIEADSPVFVVSGNSECCVGHYGKDTCATSATPSQAWGKQYVVPVFHQPGATEQTGMYFRFNAGHFPFYVTIYTGDKSVLKQILRFDMLMDTNFSNPVVISSNVSFGLSMFYAGNTQDSRHGSPQLCLVNVIPVEQWMGRFIHITGRDESFTSSVEAFVVINSDTPALISDNKTEIEWQQIDSDNDTYTFTTVKLIEGRSKIFTRTSNSRIMVYIKEDKTVSSCSLRALDYYQGAINFPHCTRTLAVKNDGLDNDCDGKIDEEFDDNQDDDGDGQVDEDIIPAYPEEGRWAEWTICIDECENTTVIHKVRSCYLHKFPFCAGVWEKCDPDAVCSTACRVKMSHKVCSCPPGCPECDYDTGECFCPPGFPDCDRKVDEDLQNEDLANVVKDEDSEFFSTPEFKIYLVIPIVAIVGLALVLLAIFVRSRVKNAEKAKSEGQSDEEDEEDDEEEDAASSPGTPKTLSRLESEETYDTIEDIESEEEDISESFWGVHKKKK